MCVSLMIFVCFFYLDDDLSVGCFPGRSQIIDNGIDETKKKRPMQLSPNTVALCVGGSYLILYSGYDKANKKFDVVKRLTALFSFRNPASSMVEINKMVGLTCMSLFNLATVAYLCSKCTSSVVPGSKKEIAKNLVGPLADRGLLLAVLWHGPYSSYKYVSRFSSTSPKRMAMFLGPISVAAMTLFTARAGGLSWLPQSAVSLAQRASCGVSMPTVVAVSSVIATAHVYLMERSAGTWSVAMRPFGLLGLVASAVVSVGAVSVSTLCGCPRQKASGR